MSFESASTNSMVLDSRVNIGAIGCGEEHLGIQKQSKRLRSLAGTITAPRLPMITAPNKLVAMLREVESLATETRTDWGRVAHPTAGRDQRVPTVAHGTAQHPDQRPMTYLFYLTQMGDAYEVEIAKILGVQQP